MPATRQPVRTRKAKDAIARAFSEFLLVPTCIITAFALLAAGTFFLDRREPEWLAPFRELVLTYIFADAEATRNMVATIAAGLITITSITISLLLIALQQSASALTHQVYDQFLRNWLNQIYFGIFVGLSLYALVTLASVGPLNPVIGGTAVLALTVVALYLLLVLFYTTVDQMRPVVIIESIHDHALAARRVQQRELLRRIRRASALNARVSVPVAAGHHGFVTHIDIDAIERAAKAAAGDVEVRVRVSIGAYVVLGQIVADVNAHADDDANAVHAALEDVIHCEATRDFASDPLYGVEELETIGWTSISTAQSDADAGVLTIYILRDLLARFVRSSAEDSDPGPAPVVYVDNVIPGVLDAFESLAVSASESMQHQSLAEIFHTFELLFATLGLDEQRRVEDIIVRLLSGLGDHVLTAPLETAIEGLASSLERAGRRETAAALRDATEKLARSIGRLGNRSSRAR